MNDSVSWLSKEIYSRYGDVKRARGCFLYTEKGVRLTDMYQSDGRALLGWEGGKARLAFKNTLERSQTGFFTTHHFHALERAVLELFGDFSRVCVVKEECVRGKMPRWLPFLGLVDASDSSRCDFSKARADFDGVDAFYFLPPFPFACDYVIVVSREDFALESELVPPVLLAAFTRSIYDLKGALQSRTEDDFRFFDKSLEKYFLRRGPYLFVRKDMASSAEQYKKFVEFCLENGVVISPDINVPSVIPFGADYGVLRKLVRADFGGEFSV